MLSDIHIPHLDSSIRNQLQAKIDQKTKPLGALGKLENLALKVGLIQQTLSPNLSNPVILVFAADHGITSEGVSPYPQAVTYQMVLNFLAGGAAINVFAQQNQIALRIIDAGVNAEFTHQPDLINAKIANGTANFLHSAAMSVEQCQLAITGGRKLAQAEIAQGSNLMGFGEMGIGNTSSASALMSALCQLPVEDCVGRGTGLDDAGILHKQTIIKQALKFHQPALDDPLKILACLGGFEIAMMVGAMLGAAEQGAALLIDGFIASTALLIASRLKPAITDYAIFTHRSGEAGHSRLLSELNAEPLLDLGMRLGEGTGAAMAYPIVEAAVNFLNQMASFDSASVSQRQD
jgi:nicotinate-nucleotide--dimethylbenzimidazole phosphoribosyltransferase